MGEALARLAFGQALELVLEQVVDRPPVDAGGLHPNERLISGLSGTS
jgi:hypothetical protein